MTPAERRIHGPFLSQAVRTATDTDTHPSVDGDEQHVIPRYEDQPDKDAIGLASRSVPAAPGDIERIDKLLS